MLDSNESLGFSYPYQDLLVKMSSALENQEYASYVALTTHLRNMSILAFDQTDVNNLMKIDKLGMEYKKHIDQTIVGQLAQNPLYMMENTRDGESKNYRLRAFVDYTFAGVIERICIYGLRKTVFKSHVTGNHDNVCYDSSQDILIATEHINEVLVLEGVPPFEG